MATAARAVAPQSAAAEHFDVLIVGAGISGVGAAYHLTRQCPDLSFAVLEAKDTFGGTWVTHRYPGVRSDSDLYTFGYRFKPWVGNPIASAGEILDYMGEVIAENDLGRHIRYGHRIERAAWSSAAARWTLTVTRNDTGETFEITAGFLWMCQGYYRHEQGYTPDWPGLGDYRGRVVHPQSWPADLDYKGKRVVVIGSGATAATLVPAIAGDCAHVTLLQRSPTYFLPAKNANDLADQLRALEVDESWIHEITRRKILADQEEFCRRAVEEPEAVTAELLGAARLFLDEETVRRHFTPRYRPWQQRVAFIPDGDLFQGIAAGKASVVTDEIEGFTATGIRLKSGAVLEADIVITATGFNLSVLGDIAFTVDGRPVTFGDTVTYRGMMATGLPNMVWIMGYFRASWTLRVDLVADFVCRLLTHMRAKGAAKVEVRLRPEDADMPLLPFIDGENFNPGYLTRGLHLMPKRGDKPEWQHNQDYWRERKELPAIDLDDGAFVYS
ncbi:flavin-containing monooxygenase [Zavarzinia compransoris]|uniref:FAD-containing monooxygenase EthA n=1 Tax=Zavarzinia compransoris TaxID=1264899 RepID=A0A317E5X5_9PROT|nr:NAD(P)/FAD-dependent oxidoreductase [Zavarzinia compransoris]PWR21744.1 FAD-containing monooxygenase EthA [Zavarzinia compransoris]TDP45466.1 cation diffusion facilitator CzcD-associated flavoprotein CzcO [Zavarzinia compransoris]